MRFHNNHLSYCTNIHPYSNLKELVNVISTEVTKVAENFTKPFAVGLHLNNSLINELSESDAKLQLLKQTLEINNLYVCSLNCFPYGEFHNQVVKEKVYQPDWGTEERVEYTIKAAKLLNDLLPKDVSGTISTVPVTYGKNLPENTFNNIRQVCRSISEMENKITLTFEPEPDCYLDCTKDCLNFFNELKPSLTETEYQHVGLCFDTCHFSVVFEDICQTFNSLIKSKINIPKVQISAALKTRNPQNLLNFVEPTYLHQTAIKNPNGTVERFSDLSENLINKYARASSKEWRVHFHVPIHQHELAKDLFTTADELPEFVRIINKMSDIHVEVETYSFSVIKGQKESITTSITNELNYILEI